MAIPGVPRGVHRSILAAIVAALRTDPILANSRTIRTWAIWDGSGPVAWPPASGMLPAAQIRLLGGPSRRLAGTRAPGRGQPMTYVNECKCNLIVDLAVGGTDQSDLSDLGAAVAAALNPGEPARRFALEARFRDAGIKDWQQTRAILPAAADSFADDGITGQGTWELTTFVDA